MEIRVYKSFEHYSSRKYEFCKRVELDNSIQFDFNGTLKVLKMLFGSSSVIEFLCV